MTQRPPVRIANCSGFYGDRVAAAREMLAGPIDVLTGDYLAELTMLILWKARRKDPGRGYAVTFLRQMEEPKKCTGASMRPSMCSANLRAKSSHNGSH